MRTVAKPFSRSTRRCWDTAGCEIPNSRWITVPISPAAHYVMGGVVTDLDGATTVPGLYAVGESACTGLHGANRLASNSLTECFVFGQRAAEAALAEPALSAAGAAPEPEW